MRLIHLVLGALTLAPMAARAEYATPMGEIYASGAWSVNLYQDPDGAYTCISEVTSELTTLAIWAYPTGEVYLNFESEDWGFDPASETYLLEIDEMGAWTLGVPEITGNAIFIELADDKNSVNFLTEVEGGNIAYLRNPAGELLAEPFSLQGSAESMAALAGCVQGLIEGQ